MDAMGAETAEKLKRRLADLRASDTITDVVVGTEGTPFGLRGAIRSVRIGAKYILLRANHQKNPVAPSGTVDWTKVTRIKIVDIVDADA